MTALALQLWRGLGAVGTPLARLYLRRRLARGKELATRIGERLGVAGQARPPGRLIWIHGASVGEAVSMLPLLDRLLARRADLNVLLTTGTVASAELMAQRLPARALHQFVPVDLPQAARSFLDHWRPDLVLWVESELWPTLLGETAARGIPAVLLNGRMSERSFRRWRLARSVVQPILATFDAVFAQSEGDAARFRFLGAQQVASLGNLKLSAPPLEVDAERLDRQRALFGTRPRWVAASTHPGEEDIAVDVHRALVGRHPDLLTVIAPRHRERGPPLARAFRDAGLDVRLRSAGQEIEPETEVYIADTLGELGLWYRLSEVVFIGGSLARRGGQNPLEPARLGCAVLHGPDMRNFADIAASFHAAGAAVEVPDGDALAAAVENLLFVDPAKRRSLAAKAQELVGREDLVLQRVADALEPYLAKL